MNTQLLTLFARTPVHVGAGNSVGAVDSPVMRERHTRIPIIPGSSLKGVLADLWFDDDNMEKVKKGDREIWRRIPGAEAEWLFGGDTDDHASAGALLIGEARVLAFPVRSAKGGFAWVTCPLALARFKRDAAADFAVPEIDGESSCLASKSLLLQDKVVLEEYCLSADGAPESDIVTALRDLSNDEVWKDVAKHLAILSDEMFSYFVEHACEVVTRVRIDDETGVVADHALFNQENVPSETLFYTAVAAQDEKKKGGGKAAAEALDALAARLAEASVIQVGGDETIGLGYCSVAMIPSTLTASPSH